MPHFLYRYILDRHNDWGWDSVAYIKIKKKAKEETRKKRPAARYWKIKQESREKEDMRRSIGSKKVKEERGKEKIYSKKEERRRSIGSAKRDRRVERRRSIGSGIEKSERRARKEKTGYKNFIIRYLPRLKRISFNRSFWS